MSRITSTWLAAALLVALASDSRAATLALGTGTASPGGRALVPLTLASEGQSPALTRVNVSVSFNVSLTFRSVQPAGSAAASPAATVTVIDNSPGMVTFAVERASLPEGTIADLSFAVSDQLPPSGSVSVAIAGASAVDAAGNPASVTTSNGRIELVPGTPDDHPDRASGAVVPDDQLQAGGTAPGEINAPDDADFFRFQQERGHYYVITVELGSLADSVLRLYSSFGTVLQASNDDFPGLGFASRIILHAATTETAHVEVGHQAGEGTGTYSVRLSDSPIDLVALSLTAGRLTVSAGSDLPVTFTARYTDPGNPDAPRQMTRFRSYTLETQGGTVVASALGLHTSDAGQTSSESVTMRIPLDTAPGTYILKAQEDSGGTVPETNESNNMVVLSSRITVQRTIDVIARSVRTATAQVAQGGSFVTTLTAGYTSTAGDTIDPISPGAALYLSQDRTLDQTDVLLFSDGFATLRKVPSQDVNINSSVIGLPGFSTVPAGVYFLIAELNRNGFGETDSGNNIAVSTGTIEITPAPQQPNFLITSVEPLTLETVAGDFIEVALTVAVTGPGLSPEVDLGRGVELGFSTTRPAGAGDFSELEVVIPASSIVARPGRLTRNVVRVIASVRDLVVNDTRTAFRRSGEYLVSARLQQGDPNPTDDFAVSQGRIRVTTFSVDAEAAFVFTDRTSVVAGQSLDVTATCRSVSGDPARRPMQAIGDIYLSSDSRFDESDIRIGIQIPFVAPDGQVDVEAAQCTVPVATPPGLYRLLFRLGDSIGVNVQPFSAAFYFARDRDPSNNVYVASSPITVRPAPRIRALSVTPLSAAVSPGRRLAVNYSFRYDNDDPAAPVLDIPVALGIGACSGCSESGGAISQLERAVRPGQVRNGRFDFEVGSVCANRTLNFVFEADSSCGGLFHPEVDEQDNLLSTTGVRVEKLSDFTLSEPQSQLLQVARGALLPVRFKIALDFLAADRPFLAPEARLTLVSPNGSRDLGLFDLGALTPGTTATIELTGVVAVDAPLGNSQVRIDLDPGSQIPENDENNNSILTADILVVEGTPGPADGTPANGDFSRGLLFWTGTGELAAPLQSQRPITDSPASNRFALLRFAELSQQFTVPATANRLAATISAGGASGSDDFPIADVRIEPAAGDSVIRSVTSDGFSRPHVPAGGDTFGRRSGNRTVFFDISGFAGQQVTLRFTAGGFPTAVDDVEVAAFPALDILPNVPTVSSTVPGAGTSFSVASIVTYSPGGPGAPAMAGPVRFRLRGAQDEILAFATGFYDIAPSGGTATATAVIAIPASVPVTQAILEAVVDPSSLVAESNEANNVASAAITVAAVPGQITITAAALASSTVAAGGSSSATVTARFDSADARTLPLAASVELYLSADATLETTRDVQLATQSIDLPRNTAAARTLSFTVPRGARAGNANILVRVVPQDARGGAAQLARLRALPVTLTPVPGGLVAVAVRAPASASAGGAISVTSTILYQAPAAAPALPADGVLRLSADERLDANDATIGFLSFTIAAGETRHERADVTLPSDLAAGLYRIFLVLDENGSLTEADESRHVAAALVAVGGVSRAGAPAARLRVTGVDGGGAQVVGLDARGSTPDGLSFVIQTAGTPAGADQLLSFESLAFYPARRAGRYDFALTVRDRTGVTSVDAASIVIANGAPLADPGPDRELIMPGGGVPASVAADSIDLDASNSSDENGDPLGFEWTLLSAPEGSSVPARFATTDTRSAVLSVPLSLELTGTPQRFRDAGVYRFGLEVSDPFGGRSTAEVDVLVLDPARLVPTADAGPDFAVTVSVTSTSPPRIGATVPDPLTSPAGQARNFVRLDGRESRDAGSATLTYSWTLTERPEGAPAPVLAGLDTATPTFVPAAAGSYRFALTVSNGAFASPADEVAVTVAVRAANRPPSAEAVAIDREGDRRARPGEPELRFRAGLGVVTLDGTGSLDPEGQPLRYLWQQIAGAPVTLSPSARAAAPAFVPPAPDRYSFALTVLDPQGLSSEPSVVDIIAEDPDEFRLSVVSSSTTTAETGGDFGDEIVLGPAGAIRVGLPTQVRLTARVNGATLSADSEFTVSARQTAGPRVLLLPLTGTFSTFQFAPTTAGLYQFEVRAARDAAAGRPAAERVRNIRAVVEAAGERAPEAVFTVRVGGQAKGVFRKGSAPETPVAVTPGTVVTLDGRASVDRNVPPRPLLYRWLQLAGPPVTLADPFSPVTTFAASSEADVLSRRFLFALQVRSGVGKGEPVAGAVETLPAGAVVLRRGLSLIGLAQDPSPTGAVRPFDSLDLLRQAGALLLVQTRAGGGFASFQGSPAQTSAVQPGAGFLVFRRGSPRIQAFSGRAWAPSRRKLALQRGMNLVSYPGPVPANTTASQLATLTGAAFIARLDELTGRFEVHLPGLSPDFAIEPGRGYLLSSGDAREVTVP